MPATGAQDGPGQAAAGELESIRSAARWLVGSAATVLVVLITGIQLSALTQLAGEARPRDLLLASISCVAALLGVGGVLVQAARVLISPGWTANKLAHLDIPGGRDWERHWLRRELEEQRALLTPENRLRPSSLYRRQRRLFVASFELREHGEASPEDLSDDAEPTGRRRL